MGGRWSSIGRPVGAARLSTSLVDRSLLISGGSASIACLLPIVQLFAAALLAASSAWSLGIVSLAARLKLRLAGLFGSGLYPLMLARVLASRCG
jgi:hypothetical protein